MTSNRKPDRRLAKIHRLFEQGSGEEALRRCRLEYGRDRDRPETLGLLARLLVETGRQDEAIAILEQALERESKPVELLFNLGLAYQSAGQRPKAAETFASILNDFPRHLPSIAALGQVLEIEGRVDAAIALYRDKLELDDPGQSVLGLGLARALMLNGQIEEASRIYDQLISQSPGLAEALSGRARIFESEGDAATGAKMLQPLVESGIAGSESIMVYGRLLIQLERPAEASQWLRRGIEAPGNNSEVSSRLHRYLAMALDRLGHYDQAIEHLEIAHQNRGRFDAAGHHAKIACLKKFFPFGTTKFNAPSAKALPTPVFIVGLPRSGTSLVEQILDAHSEVAALGERPDFLNLADSWGGIGNTATQFPRRLSSQPGDWFDDFARSYRADSRAPSGTRYITDKMPPNFLFLGLIESLFTDARVIVCERHPLDVAVSCYFQEFSGHWFDFCHDLGAIGDYIVDYRDLMAYWHASLSLPVMKMQYEQLVSDPEKMTRQLVDFLDLPWQPGCLEFYRSRRRVLTASTAQVRKPINKDSVGRFRHYLQWLGPVEQALGRAGETEPE